MIEHVHRLDNASYLTRDETGGDWPAELRDEDLRSLYGYPTPLDRPWVRVNFISSIDGAATVDGTSARLGTPADQRVFGVLRELADVIVVGAGTVRAENYGGARTGGALAARRRERGLAEVPPIAVVTASGRLDPTSRLFTDTAVPPLVLTSARVDVGGLGRLRAAGADVEVVSEDAITGFAIVAALQRRRLHRVLCEGGPGLFGTLTADGVVDELCLTTSPKLVAGGAGRIAVSPSACPTPMTRVHVLGDGDGTLLTRWVRTRDE
ncbi:pyrimidine reductase family protein [Rhodococcus spongiicola]|uniref:Pyrimidine reductase family protein n=1 Tax=Rhodococcus spongiicola TaxID=2487352 RepID=A0A438AXW2_9NOCA|nr:pyrimidine reductase family protein [Rhodococcus spongiicola]RVW03478.1 pyrimidine reductase family protein [Rhodococcus spongiicola]